MEGLERFRPGLEKALKLGGDTHTVRDVVEMILDNRAQIWIVGNALIVTEVLQFPRKRVLRFWLATGNGEDCIAVSRRVLEWGKEQGCDLAMITGRRGWVRALRDEGWTETMTVLTQEL